MKNTKSISICFAVICLLISCKNRENKSAEKTGVSINQLESVNWLIGKWANSANGIEVAETWKKENDSVYSGTSYSVEARTNDTISSEQIRLEKKGHKLFYIPVVKNQNRSEVVEFTLTSFNGKELIFENPEHDFPQKISYKLINNDSLLAEIAGAYKGKERSEKFPMHRVK